MSVRACFTGKIAAGKIDPDAGNKLLAVLDSVLSQNGRRQALLDIAAGASADAERQADLFRRTTIAQANVLRAVHAYETKVTDLRQKKGVFGFGNQAPPTLGKEQSAAGFALRSLLARDPFEIANWGNVSAIARDLRGQAHAIFADAIEALRPKALGFKSEHVLELDLLRAGFGETAQDARAGTAATAWFKAEGMLADEFIAAGGALAKRERYMPNPDFDRAKVQALGPDRFRTLVDANVDRDKMIDFSTNAPMTDERYKTLVDQAYRNIVTNSLDGTLPSGAQRGRPMVANAREAPRLFSWKNAESWMNVAEAVGAHASPYEAMLGHISAMSNDIGLMRTLGPNPRATLNFMLDVLAREPARLGRVAGDDSAKAIGATVKANKATEIRIATEKRMTEDLFAEVAGDNRIPVNTTLANTLGDARHLLSAAQLGSALISSLTDPGTAVMTARFNGIPAMSMLARAVHMMGERGSEIFAAQQGLVADTLAHVAGQSDRVMGEVIRSGVAAKLSSATIRASGLRRWTASLRAAFALETMAHAARSREQAFGDLAPAFKAALERYGIDQAGWDAIRAVPPHEPRPNALLTRPADIAAAGHSDAAERWSRLINTEMDYAVIEGDPVTRALLIGSSQPGTIGGEVRRAVTQYRMFPATFLMMHAARAAARGWDGSRLGHAAIGFTMMTLLGAVSMQAKEIAAGRDALSLDPTTGNGLRAWGRAVIQGGGLGVFGDVLATDQTKYGNTWAATIAGPLAGAVETGLGDFLVKNIQKAGKGEPTTFAGDALYAGARYLPGSSLWFGRLAFQRGVVDQLAKMIDPRAPARFQRMEEQARKDWGQDYWWRPGQTAASRAPQFARSP
jgi:hypothetical protein